MTKSRKIEDIYPLSPLQQGILYHALQGSRFYLEQFRWTLEQEVDIAAFERAWQWTVDRHPALRTSFAWEGLEEPLQIVHRQVPVRLQMHDWSGLPAAEQRRREEALCRAEQRRGFDLEQAPLLRLTLARLGPQRHLLVWSHHHLLLDGWSLPLVLADVAMAYRSILNGGVPTWPQPVPY